MISLPSALSKYCRDRVSKLLLDILGDPLPSPTLGSQPRYYLVGNDTVDLDESITPSYPAHAGSPSKRYYLTPSGAVELVAFSQRRAARENGSLPLYTREPLSHANTRPKFDDDGAILGVWVPFTYYLDANEISSTHLAEITRLVSDEIERRSRESSKETRMRTRDIETHDTATTSNESDTALSSEERQLLALQAQLKRRKAGKK